MKILQVLCFIFCFTVLTNAQKSVLTGTKHLSKSIVVFLPNVKQAVSLFKQTNSLFYDIFKMPCYFCSGAYL